MNRSIFDVTPDDTVVFGLCGTHNAGKQTFADFLKPRGFLHFSAREDVLIPEVKRRKLPLEGRTSIGDVANQLRAEHGPAYVANALFRKALEFGSDAVIESIYTVGEIETIRSAAHGRVRFFLVWIDADIEERYRRATLRRSVTDRISFAEFVEIQQREMHSPDPDKHNLAACRERADIRFENNGTTRQFHQTLELALKPILVTRRIPSLSHL